MGLLYSLTIQLYGLLISIAAAFGKKKAQLWKEGRKDWANHLAKKIPRNQQLIWFHVSSLGEFEQARPIIEKIRAEKANKFLLLTFFSPSGFEIRKDYQFADHVAYLPIDTKINAAKFIEITKPKLAVFVKYDFWFNFLNELKSHKIPCLLVSGIFRENQHFFKWYGGFFRNGLKAFNHFFVQNDKSVTLLNHIGLKNVSISGDSRIDRVLQIAHEAYKNSFIEQFCAEEEVLILGSSWEKEHQLLHQLLNDGLNLKVIIAPHEVYPEKIHAIQSLFPNAILYSKREELPNGSNVLIIDQIGLLSKIYRYASFVFIGGGFGAGIHNTLEAAVYGKAVIFGPNYKKFNEAIELIDRQAGFSVSDYTEFKACITSLLQEDNQLNIGKLAGQYIRDKAGATDKIYQYISGIL